MDLEAAKLSDARGSSLAKIVIVACLLLACVLMGGSILLPKRSGAAGQANGPAHVLDITTPTTTKA